MSSHTWELLVAQLEEHGYFRYTPASELTEVKERIIERGLLFSDLDYYWATGRVFPGDAEHLAEGGVLGFLWEIAPFLQSQGIGGMVYMDQDFAPGRFAYSVTIGLTSYNMLAAEEVGTLSAWVAVPARAFALVNTLLEKSGSAERVYTTFGSIAQNCFAVFLSPELYTLISSSTLLHEDERLLTPEELLVLAGV